MPGLIQVVVGAVVGAVITWLVRRDDYRRLLTDRWDEDKRQVYAEFMMAGNDYELLLYRLHADEAAMRDPRSINREVLRPAFERMQRALSQAMFIAQHPLPMAAMAYAMALIPSFGELEEGHDYGPYGWAHVQMDTAQEREGLVAIRGRFVIQARRELHLAAEHEVNWNPMTTAK